MHNIGSTGAKLVCQLNERLVSLPNMQDRVHKRFRSCRSRSCLGWCACVRACTCSKHSLCAVPHGPYLFGMQCGESVCVCACVHPFLGHAILFIICPQFTAEFHTHTHANTHKTRIISFFLSKWRNTGGESTFLWHFVCCWTLLFGPYCTKLNKSGENCAPSPCVPPMNRPNQPNACGVQ